MTREQLKEFVKRTTEASGLSEEQLAEKINDAFDNKSKPSIPSNLDEAAKEYMRNYIPFDQCDSRDIVRTFKAGAEWMAGRERPALTWQDITTLIRLCEQVKTEWWFRDMKGIGTQKYFEEVLRRFNEQRKK